MFYGRTDLALEKSEELSESKITKTGYLEIRRETEGFTVSEIIIESRQGEELFSRPKGTYITLELSGFLKREEKGFERGAMAVARELEGFVPREKGESVLVVGLGNPAITPDGLGHKTLKYTLATRHLSSQFPFLRPVALFEPGVLGTTGIESFDAVEAVVRTVLPKLVIAIDALSSRSLSRLCTTVQLSNTGIAPGSGVGNNRRELSEASLGVPVVAIGVPTVVDAYTIAGELTGQDNFKENPQYSGLIVTPKDIDAYVSDIARLVGYGINIALHGLSLEEVDMFVG